MYFRIRLPFITSVVPIRLATSIMKSQAVPASRPPTSHDTVNFDSASEAQVHTSNPHVPRLDSGTFFCFASQNCQISSHSIRFDRGPRTARSWNCVHTSPSCANSFRIVGCGDVSHPRSSSDAVAFHQCGHYRYKIHHYPSTRQAARGVDARQERAPSEAVDELDVQGVLAFAEHILPRASDLWVQASLDHKQRLQQLFFLRESRTTAFGVTAPLVNYLALDQSAEEILVSRIFASWNQLGGWLLQLEALRQAA